MDGWREGGRDRGEGRGGEGGAASLTLTAKKQIVPKSLLSAVQVL